MDPKICTTCLIYKFLTMSLLLVQEHSISLSRTFTVESLEKNTEEVKVENNY